MAGLRTSRAYKPSRRTRTCYGETGPIRPPRGAERDLEVNGRRFRTATRPRRTGTGLDIDTGTRKADGDHQCCQYHAHLSYGRRRDYQHDHRRRHECRHPPPSKRAGMREKRHPRQTCSLRMRDAKRTTGRLPRSRLLACGRKRISAVLQRLLYETGPKAFEERAWVKRDISWRRPGPAERRRRV